MSQNIYQPIDLQRVGPPEKPLETCKTEFVEIYEPFSEGQAKAQVDRCPSCGNPYYEWRCPVHSYIPNQLKLTNKGHISKAAELSRQTNTLPEVCGWVCPQDRLCEGSYTLDDESGAVTIGNIERYINDEVLEMGWRPSMSGVKQTDKKMAIIGAGSAGLACADILTRNDVKAAVSDHHPEIGELLTFGIPAFRLEKEVVTCRREISTGAGTESKLSTEVGRDVQLNNSLSDHGTVFLGVGTYQSMHDGLENEDVDGVYAALPFLITNTKQLMGFGEARSEPLVSMGGKRAVVLGGGDTVMNCVRMSMRQGAEHIACAYRRDEENMPGPRREVKNARKEGVEFKLNVQPLGVEVNGNDRVSGIKMVRTEVSESNAEGRRRVEVVAGSEHIVPADTMIMVFGFRPHNMEWLAKYSAELGSQGRIIAPEGGDNAFQVSNPRISADGDIVHGSDLVVTAIVEGCRVTDDVMNWLGA